MRLISTQMREPIPQFSNVIKGLKELDIAYIHLVESRVSGNADVETTGLNHELLNLWAPKPALLAGGFKPDSAREDVDKTYKSQDLAIVFGRYFISNPDLVYRIKNGIELTKYDRSTFYNPKSPKGYIDYPFSEQFQKESKL
jgi:NADPH2 dehydrogenase